MGLCAGLGACAAKPVAPLQRYSLGMARAEYRDYGKARAALCDAEPRWLTDELSSVNGLLSRFLTNTEQAMDPEAVQHARHLELLQEAIGTLGAVLEIHQRNLTELRECDFRTTGAFPDIARRGAELVEKAKARLEQGPAAVAAAELLEARRKWAEEAPAREATARQTWCTPNATVGNADLYFAREYPNGRTEWLFCDGLMVEARSGGEPQLVTPEGLTRRERRRIQPQRYLDAAKAYPASEIDRQPGAASAPSGGTTEQTARTD